MRATVKAGGIGLLCGFLCVMMWCSKVAAEESPSPAVLALAEAVRLALGHQPTLLAAKGATQSQQALVGVAKSNFFPQLNFDASYQRLTLDQSRKGTNPAMTSGESYNNYNARISLQQLLFDFGKTGASVESATENLKGSKLSEENSRQTVVINVKVAYYALLAARHLLQVQEETVRQSKEHLDQAQGFYEAGTRTKFDVTNAEVTLTNAQLDLIRAKNVVEIARVTLANAMGVPDYPIGELEELLTFEKMEVTEEQALKEGLAARPDLQSLAAQRQSAEAAVRSAQRTNFPVLSATANYGYYGGESNFPLAYNWDAGMSLTLPIFSGFLIQSQVAQARANLMVAGANEESIRQDVILDVHRSFSTLVETEERVKTAEVVVRQAQENLDLANGRFQAGIGTSLEQTDAQVLLANAKTTRIQALFDYRVAAAALLKAMGRE